MIISSHFRLCSRGVNISIIMNQCKFCLKSYVLPHDLQRHLKLKHPMKEKGHTTSPNLQQESTMSIQQQQQKLYITSNKQQQEGAYSNTAKDI